MATSREDATDPQVTIDRIARELADERAAHEATRERLARIEARARAWQRVARWVHAVHTDQDDPGG